MNKFSAFYVVRCMFQAEFIHLSELDYVNKASSEHR